MTDQRKPTQRQQALLRRLADERGQTFSVPRTAAEASDEINRLIGASPSDRTEIRRERSAIRNDLARKAGGAAAIQARELEGYGSTAGWADTNTALLVVTHSLADGTLLSGTIQGDGAAPILRSHGLRWSGDLQSWFLPNSRRRRPQRALLMRLEQALRVCNFEVDLRID